MALRSARRGKRTTNVAQQLSSGRAGTVAGAPGVKKQGGGSSRGLIHGVKKQEVADLGGVLVARRWACFYWTTTTKSRTQPLINIESESVSVPRLLVCLSLPAPPWSCAKENRPFISERALLGAGDGVDATTITQA